MEIQDNESFERAKENVLKELENEKLKRFEKINKYKIEREEFFIKTIIKYDLRTDFDKENKETTEAIEKLRREIKTLDTFIQRTNDTHL